MSTAERSTPPPAPRPRPGPPAFDETRTVPDHLVEAFTITDPRIVRRLKARREATGLDRRDEMWEGIYVVSPDPNIEHTSISSELVFVIMTIRGMLGGGRVYHGCNVSDRAEGWHKNYRIPDVAVYLAGNTSTNCGTHMCGGPDFAVEILSRGDLARKKLGFYAQVATREVLILDRAAWALELYRLTDGRLELVGVSTPDRPDLVTSRVLPLTFRLVPGQGRPTLELALVDGGQAWRI